MWLFCLAALTAWSPAQPPHALAAGTPPPAFSTLKIATWNLEWLTDRHDHKGIPADAYLRSGEDMARLRDYAGRLSADIVAVEEVDGAAVLARVFPQDHYAIHMTDDTVAQRVGFAIRRGVRFTANPDLTGLDVYNTRAPHHLRSGADITVDLPAEMGGGKLRLLAIHLKAGCRRDAFAHSLRPACATLQAQITPLAGWIAERRREGIPFLILGDFNRWLRPGDDLLAQLEAAAPLTLLTEGKRDPCHGGASFIDHILAGGAARGWVVSGSLRVMTYGPRKDDQPASRYGFPWTNTPPGRMIQPDAHDGLSDHCPVSIQLAPQG